MDDGTMIDRAKLRALAQAATPGPWEAILKSDKRGQPWPGYVSLICFSDTIAVVQADGVTAMSDQWATNAQLVAAARAAVPELLDALDDAEAANAALRAKIADAVFQIEDAPCLVSREGEGTYECRIEKLCRVCAWRSEALAKLREGDR